MTKTIKASWLLATIMAFAACHLPGRPSDLWLFTYYSGENTAVDTILTPASFLYLQKDGHYTCDFGKFDYGKWIMNDEKLSLINSHNDTTIMPVQSGTSNDLQLVISNGLVAHFEASSSTFLADINDPFALANNKWRITATHKETEKELRERLQNHCFFWIAYFNWALENKIEKVDVRNTPTPFKIYGNGFALKPYSDLPASWRTYFYDTEDCKIANNLVYETFQFHEIAWPNTDNKYKMFIGAFQQLRGYLKQNDH